jgi:succinate dehydrogenase/fumarate reductase flavoprotein subunit
MESEKLIIGKYSLNCYRLNTLVIGSGAASLNAAVSLHSLGQKDIAIATMAWGGGTSRNSGSDKQTYYKLSLSGAEPDSVRAMANDLFSGNCMHGDIALCEAQGSVRAFMNLVSLGVEFPFDKFGSFAGYKTDHDQRGRATSVGPYTSRRMFEVLSEEVKKRGIKVFDKHHCVAILTDKSNSKAIGAVAINTEEKDPFKAFVLFNCVNLILGTGGPGGIYESSVYPLSQEGSAGMAFRAGATGQNLTESQFGIASLKFRWNLSGSYQQAIPRYVSTDGNGNDEKEFLNEYFPDIRTLTRAIFLKGYQWPFDPRKISNHGSSLIDLLVHREINEKGRKVFLDYSRNPSWHSGQGFSLQNLDDELETYLKNSSALKDTPYERLLSINAPAVSLYFEHGIDLKNQLLQIAVCAQHNNGGLKGNIWWESDLKHLFPVGEVNGTHGVYRPGGSALNSGQVGSFRAAQYISKKYQGQPLKNSDFVAEAEIPIHSTLELSSRWIASGDGSSNQLYLSQLRKRMSLAGGIIRDKKQIKNAVAEASDLLAVLPEKAGAATVKELSDVFVIYDHCLTHYLYLEAVSKYLESGGRSRGSYLVADGTKQNEFILKEPDLAQYDIEIESSVLEIRYYKGMVTKKLEKTRSIPDQNLWFEKVWKDYIEDNWNEC